MGLVVFEIVNSIDNAIVNAGVLRSILPTLITFLVVGFAFYKSRKFLIVEKKKHHA